MYLCIFAIGGFKANVSLREAGELETIGITKGHSH